MGAPRATRLPPEITASLGRAAHRQTGGQRGSHREDERPPEAEGEQRFIATVGLLAEPLNSAPGSPDPQALAASREHQRGSGSDGRAPVGVQRTEPGCSTPAECRPWPPRPLEPPGSEGHCPVATAPPPTPTPAHTPRPRLWGPYVRRRLAALGLEGLLLAVRTLSVTRPRFRLSSPSLDPKSEELLSLSLLDFSVAFPKLPEDEKTGRQNHLAENRIYRILFHLPAQS